MKHFLLIGIFFCLFVTARAQNSCTQRLNQAEDDYAGGRLLSIPDRLRECLENDGFTKEEKIRARKLLALVYIFTDQDREAEQAMIDLLKVDAEHQLDPQVDPAELYFLYNQFRVNPIFRIALRGGVNLSSVNVITPRSTASVPHEKFYNGKTSSGQDAYSLSEGETEGNSYASESGIGLGYSAEILFERHLGKGIEIAVGPQFRISSYNVESYFVENNTSIKTTLTNTQRYVRAPLLGRYTLWYSDRQKKILPYAFAGGSFDYLEQGRYTSASRNGGTSYTDLLSDFNKLQQVNRINISLIGGVGAKLRVGTNFFTIEGRYEQGLKAYTRGENAYADASTVFDLGFVEDDLSLNFISVSVGYTWSVYNPQKIK